MQTLKPGQRDGIYVYLPAGADEQLSTQVLVHSNSDFSALAQSVRAVALDLDPGLVVRVNRLEDNLQVWVVPARIAATVTGALGGMGLLLACIGIYGTVAYTVTRRTREIGIRMALGAQASDVLRLVVRQGLRPIIIGAAVGMVACAAVSRIFASLLYGISTLDAVAFVGVPAVLLGFALLATYLPARRAILIDPMAAVRHD
jgi:ABC-type antimicrobial peptide transport system permease subunit